MISSTLKWMVLQDLRNREVNFDASHFANEEEVSARLIEPVKADFLTCEMEAISLWIVLDECPKDDTSGYLIVYDEVTQLFGLATKTSYVSKLGYLVGLYGSFTDTLESM
jgi:hypothetical protein